MSLSSLSNEYSVSITRLIYSYVNDGSDPRGRSVSINLCAIVYVVPFPYTKLISSIVMGFCGGDGVYG